MFDDVIKRRPKRCYDDECCIAPGELDDDVVIVQEKVKPKEVTKNKVRPVNNTPARDTKKSPKSPLVEKSSNASVKDVDEEQGLSVREITPKKKSPSPPSVSHSHGDGSSPLHRLVCLGFGQGQSEIETAKGQSRCLHRRRRRRRRWFSLTGDLDH